MPTSTGLKISQLSYVILYVRNTDAAAKFYNEKLGLKIKVQSPGWVELETGSTTLALHETNEPPTKGTPGSPYMVFNVDNIHNAYEALKKDGIKFDGEPKQVCEEGDTLGLSADFHDPDGNRLSIFSMVPKPKS